MLNPVQHPLKSAQDMLNPVQHPLKSVQHMLNPVQHPLTHLNCHSPLLIWSPTHVEHVCLTISTLGSYPPSYIRWILSTRCPIDCEVSGWFSWGICSKQCEGGEHTRTRDITKSQGFGGAACPILFQIDSCNTFDCVCLAEADNINCVLGDWIPLGICSTICGGEWAPSVASADSVVDPYIASLAHLL
jgi:hypothetical protein